MPLKIAIQMDPMESVDIDADSTFALALEASVRGHELLEYQPRHLSLRDGRVTAKVQPIEVRRDRGNHVSAGDARTWTCSMSTSC